MLKLPKVQITRNRGAEDAFVERTREWLEKENENRDPRVHASDLLDPRMAYFNKKNPQPISDKLVGTFFVGKVLHCFFTSALNGTAGVDWKSDSGSSYSKELNIVYSPDYMKKGRPYEFKTTRKPKLLQPDVRDLGLYLEQLLTYMAAENSCEGRLVCLQTNIYGPEGGSYPQFVVFDIKVTKAQLADYKKQVRKTSDLIRKAEKNKDHTLLPLCRPFKCGKNNCPHWEKCQPEGRYGRSPRAWRD